MSRSNWLVLQLVILSIVSQFSTMNMACFCHQKINSGLTSPCQLVASHLGTLPRNFFFLSCCCIRPLFAGRKRCHPEAHLFAPSHPCSHQPASQKTALIRFSALESAEASQRGGSELKSIFLCFSAVPSLEKATFSELPLFSLMRNECDSMCVGVNTISVTQYVWH